MSRILAIDYGKKRCGLAVSDPMRIIAGPLATVRAADLLDFVKAYVAQEEVGVVVVGEPHRLDGTEDRKSVV